MSDLAAPFVTTLTRPAPAARTERRAPEHDQRLLGAFYTPRSAADFMADWILRHEDEHILEPSFGDGIFLEALTRATARGDRANLRVSGVEIDPRAISRGVENGYVAAESIRCADFLTVPPFPVHGVIGNPPYVRLRRLPDDQKQAALDASRSVMAQPMDPSGSVWMPFLLHSLRFLSFGGRLAFVLPYELTYVRYARPLWRVLGSVFGRLEIHRTHERLFPDLLQDVVLLFADDFGGRTDSVHFRAYDRVADLIDHRPVVDISLGVEDVIAGKRVFVEALLGSELRELLRARIAQVTVPARHLLSFHIGYVAGSKPFFHPTEREIEEFNLPSTSLKPSIASTRKLARGGLRTSSLGSTGSDRLFSPNPISLTPGEQRYISWGEETGIANAYKCRTRNPWFVVPGTRVPDVLLSVFSECPLLLINDADCLASNSLLCGYSHGLRPEEIAGRWYTSLTLLQCEIEVHALGGGVMIMVPREAGNIRLPARSRVPDSHIERIHSLLSQGRVRDAYRAGDKTILRQDLGFTPNDVEVIQKGTETLAHWRTSARASQ